MEKFKIDLYEKETGKPFPDYEVLSKEDRADIIMEISNIIKTPISSQKLFTTLSTFLRHKDFDQEFTFDIERIFNESGFSCDEEIHILWNEEHIDKIKKVYLQNLWESLWFGGGDEAIILYCSSNMKIVLITDYGRIYYN